MTKKMKLCPLLKEPCIGKKCTFMGDSVCAIVSIDSSLSCIHEFIHTLADAAEGSVCDHEEETAGLYN